jgi:hypothetical protein
VQALRERMEGGVLLMVMDTDYISFDDYIEMIKRNFSTLNSTWDAQEKETARLIARLAAEQLASFIEKY